MAKETKNYKLTYFTSRGIAEPIRLMFHFKGIPFEEVTFSSFIEEPSREGWLKHKQNYLYGQLPNIEWDEGSEHKALAQSQTICRYLANKFGLAGSDSWEAAKADEIAEWFKDIWADFVPFLKVATGFVAGDKNLYFCLDKFWLPDNPTVYNLTEVDNSTEVDISTVDNPTEAEKKKLFVPLIYNRLVPTLADILNKSGSGFLLPSGITWTDFVIVNALTTFNNIDKGELFKSQQLLANYEKSVYSSNENVKKYVTERAYKEF